MWLCYFCVLNMARSDRGQLKTDVQEALLLTLRSDIGVGVFN